jgi:hypothetical protein
MTDPGNSVAVGGKYMAMVSVDGTWTLSLQLGPGRNSTTFVATDPDSGLETETAIRVYYVEPPGYEGENLRIVWHVDHEGNAQKEYYLDQQPTGYFSGSRLPLRWSADGSVDRSVAMASRDESIPLQAFNAPFDGLVMLLEPAGRGEYLVLDEQPVMIAKGAAVLTAACPVNDIPHIVTLSLTRDGLDPTQAWVIDPNAGTLTQVDVEALDCPGFEARTVGDDGIGAITTRLGCAFGTECDHRIYDISTGSLAPMEYWSYGGSLLDGDLYHSDHAFAHVSQTPFDAARPGSGRVWLEEMIAKDWTGRPIWRVLDATPELDLYAHYDCWVTSADDHLPAVAEVDHTDNRRLVRAWAVSTDGDHFVEVDPNSVQCQEEEGD